MKNTRFEGDLLEDPPHKLDSGGFKQCRERCMAQQTAGNECKYWTFTKKPPSDRGICKLYNAITSEISDNDFVSGNDSCW